jgi:hypothetical protein
MPIRLAPPDRRKDGTRNNVGSSVGNRRYLSASVAGDLATGQNVYQLGYIDCVLVINDKVSPRDLPVRW